MRFPVRLTAFIVTLGLLAVLPVAPVMATDTQVDDAPHRITSPMVVDLVDDHRPDDEHGSGHGHLEAHDTGSQDDEPDRIAAAEEAARILAGVQARLESAPARSSRATAMWPAFSGYAATSGFSVAYDPSYPTPSIAKSAIEDAVQTWDDALDTDGMPVVVWVVWKSFGNSRVLGSGGPYELRRRDDLPTDHYYPAPLANVLAGTDVNGPDPEIVIVLNKDLADSGSWHYGSAGPPAGQVDLRSVVTHEIGHGVGFVSSAGTQSGPITFTAPPFIYDAQGVYQGAPVIDASDISTALTSGDVTIKISNSQSRLAYTPSSWRQGTSFSHFVPSSGSLMEPTLDSGTTSRSIDSATLGVLRMIGWPTDLYVTGPPAVTSRALDGQIERVYIAHLTRRPDDAGFAFWIDQRARGLSLPAMIAEFQSSDEFIRTYGSLDNTEFVTLIYDNVLGRDPDSGGLAHWTGLLDSGLSRAEVTEGFVESAEFVRITDTDAPYPAAEGPIRRLYLAFFGREGTASDVTYWTGRYSGGTPLVSIADFFSTSVEFDNTYGSLSDAQFVNLVYLSVLGRSADWAGFDFWMAQLDAGTSRGEMMLEFSQSAEFIKSTGTLP